MFQLPRSREMFRSREGRSDAGGGAAAAAWPAILTLAIFFVVPTALPLQTILPPHPNVTCRGVPRPFGIKGKALPGFEVTCGPNNEVMLPIGNNRYRIDEISLEGFITIFAGPIHQACYAGNGKLHETNGTGQMDLAGTPFTFSKRNKLTAIGCNYQLLASFKSLGDNSSTPTTCTTVCRSSSEAISYDSCSRGLACCQTEVVHSAQAFDLSFAKTKAEVMPEENSTCSVAFFLDQDQQVFPDFSSNASDGLQKSLKDELVQPGNRSMSLDWAIGRNSCNEAKQHDKHGRPAECKASMSECSDLPSRLGYLCKCHAGYAGNPYLDDGCEDINECQAPVDNRDYPCVFPEYCINVQGGFHCSCPPGMSGDGYRSGNGCTPSPPPPGSPLQPQTQGDQCLHSETNPCIHSDLCVNEQVAAHCTCPPGMSGDGTIKGSGCQKAQNSFPIDIALGVGLALVVTITTTTLCFYWSIKKREIGRKRAELFRKNGGLLLQQRFSTFTSQGMDLSAKIFSVEDLKTATDNYSENRILGRGGHGIVYKGVLPDKTVIAIKKSTVFDENQVEQFVNEIAILSQIDHPNVVKLLGCCLDTEVPLLVYEFIANGTLFQHIHNRIVPRSLTWEDCIRIAAETAEALAYLHFAPSIPIIHRDIKSSNILLDENYVPKIADFGASRSVPFDHTHITTLVQGTIGYLDPEYFQNSQLTEKSDVYSFGIVLAELLTRQKPVSLARPEELRNLAMYLVMLVNEGHLLQVIEPSILAEAGQEQLFAVAQLSIRCLHLKGDERPAMKEVASVLDGLRRSFAKEQTIISKYESIQRNDEEEEYLLHEARPPSSLHLSEGSRQYSMEVEILASSHLPR